MPAEFRRRPLLGALGTVWGATAATAQAGWRPERPIRMITPSGAGSGADVVARTLAAKLSELLGQPVVVENQSQGVGAVGILNAARAKPDGYTMMCVISSILLAPLVDPSLAYDVRQFAPLSQIHQGATVLAVAPGVPTKTLEEFLALARAKPDDYSIADYGHGTASHIHAALLIKRAGLPVENIHYSNTPQIFQDMIAGRMRAAVVDSASGSQPIRHSTPLLSLRVHSGLPKPMAKRSTATPNPRATRKCPSSWMVTTIVRITRNEPTDMTRLAIEPRKG